MSRPPLSRALIRQMYYDLKAWRAVGAALGVSAGSAQRYATTDWEPTSKRLRRIFGYEAGVQVTYIRQVRDERGRFA